MTVLDCVKESRSGALLNKNLISYAQSCIRPQEQLLSAAVVYYVRTPKDGPAAPDYLQRLQSSAKLKAVVCVTTERIAFFSSALGATFTAEFPYDQAPTVALVGKLKGIGVSALTVEDKTQICTINANRKLIAYLKSGMAAGIMIYNDRIRKQLEARKEAEES